MRRVQSDELSSDFERHIAWGDDERYYFNPNRRKASVFGYFLRLNLVLQLINRWAPGRRVGDFASGQGNFSLSLAEQGFDVTAVDLQADFLNYARKKYTHGEFRTVQANIIEYRSPEPFHCILMGEVIEHVAHPEKLLRSAYENLVPGGVLVLTTPNGAESSSPLPTYRQVTDVESLIPRQFHWGDHLFLYTEAELKELASDAGFEVLETLKFNSSYVSQIKALRYAMPMTLLLWLERKTRNWKRGAGDSANSLVLAARRPGLK